MADDLLTFDDFWPVRCLMEKGAEIYRARCRESYDRLLNDVWFSAPSELDRQHGEAAHEWEMVKYLRGMIQNLDTLAATDLQKLTDEWPGILKALEAKFKGEDIGEAVASLRRGGRPPRFRGREDVLNWLRPQVEAIINDNLNPSIEMVAGYIDCHENNIRHHIHNPPHWDWPDWEAVVEDIKKLS